MTKTTGDRVSWLNEVADQIMDGGDNPPSIDRLFLLVPDKIVTGINDGHNTAAAVLGEAKRNDYRAGQRIIIEEMVQLLRDQGFVNGDDAALRWLRELDGEWMVQVDDRQFAIRGQRERRASNERHLLGERDEDTGERIGVTGVLESGKARPFEVEVLPSHPRGKPKHISYQVHELAFLFPPMTESEREVLRQSIAKDGVKVPLEIFEGKVIDGRNRLYFASVLKKPVHIKEFIGTYEEARRHIITLNLARRHLNPLQRNVMVAQLYGPQAKRKAAEAKERGRILGNQSRSSLSGNLPATVEHKEWHQIAADAANKDGWGIGEKGESIRVADEIIDAPQTKAAVERGVLTIASKAKHLARIEKGKPSTYTPRDSNGENISQRLGTIIESLFWIIGTERPIERSISDRLVQAEQLIREARIALRNNRVIK